MTAIDCAECNPTKSKLHGKAVGKLIELSHHWHKYMLEHVQDERQDEDDWEWWAGIP